MAIFRSKDKNPFDELVSFCQSNRIIGKEEVRLRGIIDRINKFEHKIQISDTKFCQMDSSFYGEKIDKIGQISLRTFNGEELKEYVQHCINESTKTKPTHEKRGN